MEWFLLWRFLDLLRVYSWHIINRNHSNMFLLNNLQKTQTYPKYNIAARAVCHDIAIPFSTYFCLRGNVYFNDMQIKFPANICWSWRRLQQVFSITILRLPRRLEDLLQDVLKTSSRRLQDVLEDEKLLRWRRLEDMSWRRLEDMSWRRLEDMS